MRKKKGQRRTLHRQVSFGHKVAVFLPTALTVCGVEALLHAPLPLEVAGLVGAYCLARKSPEIYEAMREHLPLPAARTEKERSDGEWSTTDRLLGRHYRHRQAALSARRAKASAPTEPLPRTLRRRRWEASSQGDKQEASPEELVEQRRRWRELDDEDLSGEEEDLPLPSPKSGPFLFSSVLERFHPSLERIFLARTATGVDLYCTARDLCHVALAGNTGGGKSSIMRMLMLQLCKVGARVLLLNPHYTGYDIDNDEDWTPFEPYLVHPPMECRDYKVIEHYLKTVAKDVIPRRLERRAHSLPVGKPYFIVIDELPSIIREIPAASEYMRYILEEGRKVGVFLISAAHDFLVKTIAPKTGGGSIRECYRTAYYVGGDATTARTLLDMPSNLIPEHELGKGVAMLRCVPTKKAVQVYVPYVDNASLYRLLGPSTYQGSWRVDVPDVDLQPAQLSDLKRQPDQAIYPPVNAEASIYRTVNTSVNGSTSQLEAHRTSDHLHLLHPSVNGNIPAQTEEETKLNVNVNKLTAGVSAETRKHIRTMVEMKKFNHADIARIVGLYGPKYKIYKQVCIEEGLMESEASNDRA